MSSPREATSVATRIGAPPDLKAERIRSRSCSNTDVVSNQPKGTLRSWSCDDPSACALHVCVCAVRAVRAMCARKFVLRVCVLCVLCACTPAGPCRRAVSCRSRRPSLACSPSRRTRPVTHGRSAPTMPPLERVPAVPVQGTVWGHSMWRWRRGAAIPATWPWSSRLSKLSTSHSHFSSSDAQMCTVCVTSLLACPTLPTVIRTCEANRPRQCSSA